MSSSLFKEQPKKASPNNVDKEKMRAVMALIGGRNPKEVFYEECQRRGVDPNSILSQIK